jgi:hypothetical protein
MLFRLFTGRLALLAFSGALVMLYVGFIQPGNAYLGYRPLEFTLEYFVAISIAALVIGFTMPLEADKPSDFFRFFYSLLVVLPYGLLYASQGEVSFDQFLLMLSVLSLPLMLLSLTTRVTIAINTPAVISARTIGVFLFVCMVFGTIYILLMAPKTASFDLASIYVRRLDAREVFTAGSLGAYVQSITVNGLLPLTAYLAGIAEKRSRLLVVIACGAAFFYVLGLRAQFPMIAVGYLLGLNVSRSTVHRLPRQVLAIVAAVMAIAVLEWLVFDLSVVGDQIVRRVFTVPPFIISAYFDLMRDVAQGWSMISGLSAPGGVTYLVGELYFNSPDSNANTNTFIYQLASGGVAAYAANVFLVTAVFILLDSLHRRKRQPVFLYLGFIFSVLLVEQNATTTLLSSGIGLFIIVYAFSKTMPISSVAGAQAKT